MTAVKALPVAAAVYVLAWLTGLFAAPARPTDDGAAAVRDYFLEHSGAAVAQSLLVHGVAGVCLGVLAWSLSRLVDRSGGAVLLFGMLAAVLSLVQVAVLLLVTTTAESAGAATVQQRVGWIDTIDTAKLTALAVFAVIASLAAAASGLTGGWLVPLSVVLAVLLVAGGASFLVSNGALTAALYVSLPVLLLWVGVLGVTVARASSMSASSPAGTHG